MLPVKVCGLTRERDARLAWELGASALGFIFHPASPRHVSPERAAEIRQALPAAAFCVGVFVDRPADEVNAVARRVGLGAVQLHGDEPPALCAQIELPVIKALRAGSPRLGEEYPAAAILLDAFHHSLPGGTGRQADWALGRELAGRCRLILAGGLGPRNLEAAVTAVGPAAVDLNSGVESAPGVKSEALLRAVFADREAGERPCLLASAT
jgi:phosphoribosylanthranilate isomerase